MRLKVDHCCRNGKRMNVFSRARDRDVSPNRLAAQLAIIRDTWPRSQRNSISQF
uniref:Uncharacterized protein n=1 Tax=Cucumis sativus TaxID=3659 RepID=A0A0A0K914_CUCSA